MAKGKKRTEDMDSSKQEFRITGVGRPLYDDVKSIVSHIGVSMSDYLKTKIADAIKSEPPHYKKPLEK
jgi:hypothetical protein